MEEVSLPAPPEGFEYKLVAKPKKKTIIDKDRPNLSTIQLSKLKYKENNKDKVREQNKLYYERNKEKIKEKKRLQYEAKKSVVTSGQTE